MKAFHNDPRVKEKYLKRVQDHRIADEFIKGQYWVEGKGCAVGCTIHGSDHRAYETELGIPQWLAIVEDCIFEGLPIEKSKTWPEEFLSAINPGADLSKVEAAFFIFILESNLANFDHVEHPNVKAAIDECIRLYRIGDLDKSATWSAAEYAASFAGHFAAVHVAEHAAKHAAWSASWSAVRSAAVSDTGAASWSAVRSAAVSDTGAASGSAVSYALFDAGEAAWYAVRSAAASYAWSDAEGNSYEKFAEKLLELLKSV